MRSILSLIICSLVIPIWLVYFAIGCNDMTTILVILAILLICSVRIYQETTAIICQHTIQMQTIKLQTIVYSKISILGILILFPIFLLLGSKSIFFGLLMSVIQGFYLLTLIQYLTLNCVCNQIF